MRDKIRKGLMITFGLVVILYVLFSRRLYVRLFNHNPKGGPLPIPFNEALEIQPAYLWGLLLVGLVAFWLFLLLMSRQLNWEEYRSLILIASVGFLLDALRLIREIFYPPREGTLELYLLYVLAGAAGIGIPLLIRWLEERRRRIDNRDSGSA